MSDHKIQPKGQGRRMTCAVCGYAITFSRANRIVRKPHWKHLSWAQGAAHLAYINPNRT